MINGFSKIFGMLLLVLGLFIYPALIVLENQDDLAKTIVMSETIKFVESSTNTGKISTNTLKVFLNNISATNNVYKVNITHYKYMDIMNHESSSDGDDYLIVNNDEIMDFLLSGEVYKMDREDMIQVEVINQNKTMATKIQEMLYNTHLNTEKIYIRYGGVVKNEAK